MTTAGFIGLGSQGGGMARRMLEQGGPTTLWARRPEALEPFGGAAAFAADPVEVGRRSDIVGICVTDGEVGLGSLDPIAGHAGPLLGEDVGLFADEVGGVEAPAAGLLAAADHFLDLVDHPR